MEYTRAKLVHFMRALGSVWRIADHVEGFSAKGDSLGSNDPSHHSNSLAPTYMCIHTYIELSSRVENNSNCCFVLLRYLLW